MSQNQEDWKAAMHAREWSRGNKPADSTVVENAAIIEDDGLRRLYEIAASGGYDPAVLGDAVEGRLPHRFKETDLARIIRSTETSERLETALREGESQVQSFMVGDPGLRSDISGIEALGKLERILGHAAPVLYLYGRMGSGKTDFALLCAEIWKRSHPEGKLISNIVSWEEADVTVTSYGELMDWIDVRREEGTEFLFVFDEASTTASGRGSTGHTTGELMAPLVYRIRKVDGGLLTIGHDGGDIHVAIRALADVVEKESKKRASFYKSIRNRQPRDPLFRLKGIPPTGYTFSTKESSTWSWDEAEDEDPDMAEVVEERAEELAEDELKDMVVLAVEAGYLTRGEAGDLMDVTPRTIDRWRTSRDPDSEDDGGGSE